MQTELENALKAATKKLYGADVEPELDWPDEKFGDFSTNLALKLAGQAKANPTEVAEAIVAELKSKKSFSEVSVAGPGFINVRLSDPALNTALKSLDKKVQPLKDQQIVIEYSDPNPFKMLHVGHLYTSLVGDALANLLGASGANVHRVNFGGDVGLHVAKTMWAILDSIGGENPGRLKDIPEEKRPQWLSDCYIRGTRAYDDDPAAKSQIVELNKSIYRLVDAKDSDSPLAQIYWTTRAWSYDYFEQFYSRIGSKFERYYYESEVSPVGLATVKQQMDNGVFKESDGAVVFEGEPYGLHTRVFINSEGLPTYEAKDIGLIIAKWRDYKFDRSIVITGNEQEQYMSVVLKALEQFEPKLAQATTHITHGLVKLAGNTKMSSRAGNILGAEEVLDTVNRANLELNKQDNPDVAIGAVKYALLKQRTGGDIIFDPQESVSLEGNSGPYLQYAHARAKSILSKAGAGKPAEIDKFEPNERSLARKISQYPRVVETSANELMPHHIATYLYELSSVFNRFYEGNRVLGDKRQSQRLNLVERYSWVLKDGLGLLGITAPDHL